MVRRSAPNLIDMNLSVRAIVILAIAFTILVVLKNSHAQRRAEDAGVQILDPVIGRAGLYPANADAKKEIGDAVSRAALEHMRVLLVFGADWCYDCHVLDHALHDGDAGKIMSEKFLLVHVDIGEGAKNGELISKYKIPLDKGVPAVAILDANGKLLYSSGDGEFEAARKMMKKDLVAFLRRWQPES
jgi:thiol:disulfide interchange protein